MADEAEGGEVTDAENPALGAPFGIVDPDYARIFTEARILAWQYGYGCMMHGSFTRDLDLLLVPWTNSAVFEAVDQRVLPMLCERFDLYMHDGYTEKPHGRLARSLYFKKFGDSRWVDISIMPCRSKAQEAKPCD